MLRQAQQDSRTVRYSDGSDDDPDSPDPDNYRDYRDRDYRDRHAGLKTSTKKVNE